jgi:hypothetical protein
MKMTKILQLILRIAGVIQLILGIVVWIGSADSLVSIHILLGVVITLALFLLVYQALRAGVNRWLVALAGLWAIGLPVWGMLQEHIFPGAYEWLAQVLHLLCGIGALGLAEMLAPRIVAKGS